MTNLVKLMCPLLLFSADYFSLAGTADSSTPASDLAALLTIDPTDDSRLRELARTAEALIEIANLREKESKAEKKQATQMMALSNMPVAALKQYFHGSPGDLRKRDVRGLDFIVELSRAALGAPSREEHDARVSDICEVMAALRNNLRSPVPERIGINALRNFLSPDWRRTVGRGTTTATNLAAASGGKDLSQYDPAPSSFWVRPPDISRQDLYAGFGRVRIPSFTNMLFAYAGPKTSSGTGGGFDVEGKGLRFQIKFNEVSSEPFAARIFHALGFYVDPTDYTPQLKVNYDRRLFREFHMRKPLTMRVDVFGIPIFPIELQSRHDPFNYVASAEFKDGRRVSGEELKQILFRDPHRNSPEDAPENFREDIEAELACLILSPANVQPKDTPAENIGPWDFGGLGHENLRELRGAGLLAAWLGWCDSRWDNTRLRIMRNDGRLALQHFFTDLGAGMGGATGSFSLHGEDANQLTWVFTRPEVVRGSGRMTTPFRITHFHPIFPTPAFHEMTVDDARWMARLIGQLTEEQIRAALIASGYDAAETRIYEEKLVSRRDDMVRHLKLDHELQLLRPRGPDRSFNFNTQSDGPVKTKLPTGEEISARSSTQIVREGKLSNQPLRKSGGGKF